MSVYWDLFGENLSKDPTLHGFIINQYHQADRNSVSDKDYFKESPSDHYLETNDGDHVESQ